MALIRVECGACRTALQVRGELAGQQGKCPKCGATIAIPSAGPAVPPAANIVPPPAATAVASTAASAPVPPPALSAARPPVAGAAASPAPSVVAPFPAAGADSPPAASVAPSPAMVAALSQASAPDFIAEIARRKKSAVMVVFETPPTGAYELSRQPDANVRCYRTPDMSDAQLMQVLEQVGHMSQGALNQKGGIGLEPEGGPQPFELKGDRLGMTLDTFKTKYTRRIGSMTLPYCSDLFPGQTNHELRTEPWHAAAGIVHGRVDLPSEGNPPTIAGVKTELLVYQFVDGQLFRITATFDTESFHLIHEALVGKQGPPTRESKEPMELAWDNGLSTIKLLCGTMRPKRASALHFIHHELQKAAEGRAPKRGADL